MYCMTASRSYDICVWLWQVPNVFCTNFIGHSTLGHHTSNTTEHSKKETVTYRDSNSCRLIQWCFTQATGTQLESLLDRNQEKNTLNDGKRQIEHEAENFLKHKEP